MHASARRTAFKTSIPVFFGYLPLGISFGVLFATQLDYSWLIAPLMGVLIYAGSGQLLAVSLLVSMAGLTEVFVAMFLLNARHIFYGLSLLKAFEGAGLKKLYLIFGLTDEVYSLQTSRPRKANPNKTEQEQEQLTDFYITLFCHSYWVLGCAVGAWLGATLDFDATGIEFALVALFIVLAIEQYKALQNKFPVIAGGLAAGIALLFFGASQQLVVAMLLVVLALLAQYKWQGKHGS